MSDTEKSLDTSNNLERAIVYFNDKHYQECLDILLKASQTEPANLKLGYWLLKTMCHTVNFKDKQSYDSFERLLLVFYRLVKYSQFENLVKELKYELEVSHSEKIKAIAVSADNSGDAEKVEELFHADARERLSYLQAKVLLAKAPLFGLMGGSEKKETPEDCDFIKEKKEFPPLEDIRDFEYGMAARIVESTIEFFEKSQDSNANFAKFASSLTRYKIVLAKQLLKDSIPKETEEGMTETRLERMKLLAEIMAWELNAVLRFEGKSMSFVTGGISRNQAINELNELYTSIKKMDPSFQAPPLPSQESIEPQNDTSGGCYVATAVYGSYDCPEVWTLRRYRDNILSGRWYGRAFIRTYYAVSPTLVRLFGKKQWFNDLFKPRLDKFVLKLKNKGVADTPYYDRQAQPKR